jgi:hypothetical protein
MWDNKPVLHCVAYENDDVIASLFESVNGKKVTTLINLRRMPFKGHALE